MLTKRIIPCLDVRAGRVTKGVRFKHNMDIGDPVEMAAAYSEAGCDELVFYDITASAEQRRIDLEMVRRVARAIHIPFAVGGGIASLSDMEKTLLAGADKISVNSLAVLKPELISAGARAFGSQCIVVGMDPVKTGDRLRFPSGYEITIYGFRKQTGLDALEWAKKVESLGAGEAVVNSVDADGTRRGYELTLTRMMAENLGIPVVASGGAGECRHIVEVFTDAHADAAIIAGILHEGRVTIRRIKEALHAAGVPVRMRW